MNRRRGARFMTGPLLGLASVLTLLAGCGGGSGTGSNPPPFTPPVDNTLSVQVNLGPVPDVAPTANVLYTAVKVCVPGSSTSCQTITNVAVDTGSEGLRLLNSALNGLTLPALTQSGTSNVLQECVQFADLSYTWGQVDVADIHMAGETASSVPIQVIYDANSNNPLPSSCIVGTNPPALNSVDSMGANGIIGIGNFRQDCGGACTSSSSQVPSQYFLCALGSCSNNNVATVPLGSQLQNPVWIFPQDNNGVLVSLPSVPVDTGSATVSGSLIFGIGTQTDNALGSAQVYTADPSSGSFATVYNNISYTSYIDSGSNGLYFLDATTLSPTGIVECTDNQGKPLGYYCPVSPVQFTNVVTNKGANGTTGAVNFSIVNAVTLFNANNGKNAAFSSLGGDNPGYFDWGLPFFYDRSVFVGIEGQKGPGGVVGPYWAY